MEEAEKETHDQKILCDARHQGKENGQKNAAKGRAAPRSRHQGEEEGKGGHLPL